MGMRPVFVVGTGRCGSTLLSDMVRLHPRMLSVSEFFYCLQPIGFPDEPIDGRGFWHILSSLRPNQTRLLSRGFIPKEVLYPGNDPAARFSFATGVPPILLVTLPHLTAEPDALFDAIGDLVGGWPERQVADHYRALLEWLSERFGREVWLERSGGSLGLLPQFLAHFPESRYVHVIRDGRDAALSMSGHHSFRMGVIRLQLQALLGFDPYAEPGRPIDGRDALPPGWENLLPDSLDAETYRRTELPVEAFGSVWSGLIQAGLDQLATLPADRVLSMRYEDLMEHPAAELERFAAFVGAGMADPRWIEQAVALCHPHPSRWPKLPEDVRSRLQAACAPGLERLGYA